MGKHDGDGLGLEERRLMEQLVQKSAQEIFVGLRHTYPLETNTKKLEAIAIGVAKDQVNLNKILIVLENDPKRKRWALKITRPSLIQRGQEEVETAFVAPSRLGECQGGEELLKHMTLNMIASMPFMRAIFAYQGFALRFVLPEADEKVADASMADVIDLSEARSKKNESSDD